MDDLITIYRAEDAIKAEMIKSQLENAGIMSTIKLNSASGTMPHLQFAEGIEVQVNPEDVERAKTLLNV